MKLSVSLPDDAVAFLDTWREERGVESRSAALHAAVERLRDGDLMDAYDAAWDEWVDSGERDAWAGAVAEPTR